MDTCCCRSHFWTCALTVSTDVTPASGMFFPVCQTRGSHSGRSLACTMGGEGFPTANCWPGLRCRIASFRRYPPETRPEMASGAGRLHLPAGLGKISSDVSVSASTSLGTVWTDRGLMCKDISVCLSYLQRPPPLKKKRKSFFLTYLRNKAI
jgi:hypothetical protein